MSYQTSGITWWADYNVTYAEGANANACRLDVGAWVSILNQSGASYPDAKLKLVAGDVHRAPPGRRRACRWTVRALARRRASAAGFEEKAFFEYHLYTLGRPTSVPDNSTKQIELFPAARGVPCEKTLVYYGLTPCFCYGPTPITDRDYGIQSNRKVDVYLVVQERAGPQHGHAAARRAASGCPSSTTPTRRSNSSAKTRSTIRPRNEKVLIKLGSAFDVVGERSQVNFSVDTSRRTMTEEIEVKLRNQKKEPVTVIVKENLYRWVNWTHRAEDARIHEKRMRGRSISRCESPPVAKLRCDIR